MTSTEFAASLEEIVGQGDGQFFGAATAAQMHENDDPVLKHGTTSRTEDIDLKLRDGRTFTVLSVKHPQRNAACEIVALCGISTDITRAQTATSRTTRLRR